MSDDYIIKKTDTNNGSFVVKSYTWNGTTSPLNTTLYPGAISANTSLVLMGKGTFDYGEPLQNNLIYLLENFSNLKPPINPIQGQQWYKNDSEEMYVWNGSVWKLLSKSSNVDNPDDTTVNAELQPLRHVYSTNILNVTRVINPRPDLAITNVITGSSTSTNQAWVVSGNQVSLFPSRTTLRIINNASVNNNLVFTVRSTSFDSASNKTTIQVFESIPSATTVTGSIEATGGIITVSGLVASLIQNNFWINVYDSSSPSGNLGTMLYVDSVFEDTGNSVTNITIDSTTTYTTTVSGTLKAFPLTIILPFTYKPSNNSLLVFANGIKLYNDVRAFNILKLSPDVSYTSNPLDTGTLNCTVNINGTNKNIVITPNMNNTYTVLNINAAYNTLEFQGNLISSMGIGQKITLSGATGNPSVNGNYTVQTASYNTSQNVTVVIVREQINNDFPITSFGTVTVDLVYNYERFIADFNSVVGDSAAMVYNSSLHALVVYADNYVEFTLSELRVIKVISVDKTNKQGTTNDYVEDGVPMSDSNTITLRYNRILNTTFEIIKL